MTACVTVARVHIQRLLPYIAHLWCYTIVMCINCIRFHSSFVCELAFQSNEQGELQQMDIRCTSIAISTDVITLNAQYLNPSIKNCFIPLFANDKLRYNYNSLVPIFRDILLNTTYSHYFVIVCFHVNYIVKKLSD